MRRPRIGLGYVMELIVAAAIVLALVRWVQPSFSPQFRASGWIRLIGGSLLSGLALSAGVGLSVEMLLGRMPSTWGLGRWIWSIAGLFMIFYAVEKCAVTVVGLIVHGDQGARGLARAIFQRIAIHQFFDGFAWAIAAVCTTAMLAQSPRDPEPDAREWAGRVFASLAVALNIAEPLLRAAGR